MTTLRERLPLPPQDDAKLAPASADLQRSIAASKRCTAAVARFVEDVDSDRIPMAGVVVDFVDDDEGSLSSHVRQTLAELGAGP